MATNMDETEGYRRELLREINSEAAERVGLEKQYGRVWNTNELSRDFDVIGFMAPFVVVIRKSDGKKGSLMFQHSPRYYFEFAEDR